MVDTILNSIKIFRDISLDIYENNIDELLQEAENLKQFTQRVILGRFVNELMFEYKTLPRNLHLFIDEYDTELCEHIINTLIKWGLKYPDCQLENIPEGININSS